MNEVCTQYNLQDVLKRILYRFKSYENKSIHEILSIVDNKIKVGTEIQFLFGIKVDDPYEAKIIEIIMTHLVSAEQFGPGAFEMTLKMVLNKLEYFVKGFQQTNKQEYSGVISCRPNDVDIEKIIESTTIRSNLMTSSMLREAIKLSGFGGRIIVEKVRNGTSSVELVRGYNFAVRSAWPISTKLIQPRIFVIDGYIEAVSEIHHLLEAASEAKESAVLFTRGMSNDVIHTLKTNFDRGTLKIVPVVVQFDIDGINTVNDIAIVTGSNMISSNKGDIISSLKFHEAPRVNAMHVYADKVLIQETRTATAVQTQISFLKKKRDESKIDTGDVFNKRIRSLSPNQVVIRLPDNKDFVRSSQAIDIALRKIKALVDFGTIDGEITTTKIASDVYSTKCISLISSLGAIIT